MEINLNMGVFNALEDNEMMEIDGGDCSWKGSGSGIVQGAVGGGTSGAVGGTVTLPLIGTVSGWLGGGLLGGVGGGLAYAATCWWG